MSEYVSAKSGEYPSDFPVFFIILQIFFATRAVLKIGEYSRIFPSFSWGIFGHVTRLDQSRASEKIWWIISSDIFTGMEGSLRDHDGNGNVTKQKN